MKRLLTLGFCGLFLCLGMPSLSVAQTPILTESFDGTTFAPTGWTNVHVTGTTGTTARKWKRATSSTTAVFADWLGINPGTHTGAGMAWFNCTGTGYGIGCESDLSTSVLNFSIGGAYTVSFWMYRGDGLGAGTDELSVYVNTTASATGGTLLGSIYQDISETPSVSSEGWYKYTYTIPASFSGTTNYIVFRGISDVVDDILIDDVEVDRYAPCTGVPALPIVTGPSAICTGVTFTLTSVTNSSPVYTHTWQSAPSPSGPWTTIGTGNSYTSAGITSVTYYRLIDRCTGSGLYDTSAVDTVTILSSGICGACVPSTSFGCSTDDITNVTFVTINNSTGCTGLTTGSSLYASPDPSVVQGSSYTLTVSTYGSGGGDDAVAWIDFNQNGTFESSEQVLAQYSSGSDNNTYTISVLIPSTATIGTTLMRVRSKYNLDGETPDPCATYNFGQTQDYYINIVSPCPFTLSASNGGPVCPGSPLTLTGTTTAPTYSWTGPSGFSSTALSPIVSSAVAGVYTITGSNGTCTTTATTTVSLLAAPNPPIVSPADTTICNGAYTAVVASVTPTPATILSQNFNSAISSWTTTETGTSGSSLAVWQTEPDGYTYTTIGSVAYTFHSPDNSPFAIVNSDASGSGYTTISNLVSPTFSLAGYSSATLTYDIDYYYISNDNSARLDISTDGGTTWTTIYDYATAAVSVGSATSFGSASWSLAPYLGYSNCKIRFVYNSTWGWWWALDNILIAGTPIVASPPIWTPSTYLYHNSSFTTPYVAGDTATTVYVHPTTVSSPTTINYIATVTNGTCTSFDTSVVTINPAVPAITGNDTICVGTTTTLGDATGLGTWSTSNNTVATIDPVTGVVTGHVAGTDTVYYTVTGCSAFTVITVNTAASPITGLSGDLCSGGSMVALGDASGSGSWTTTNASVATVSSSGVVTSHFTGTATISYTLPDGCYATALVTVDSLPAASISGTTSFCTGGSTVLTVTGTPGAVVSYDVNGGSTSTVTIGASGSATISTGTLTTGTYAYNLESAALGTCTNTLSGSAVVTVNPLPGAITGAASVCSLAAITLTDTTAGGTWSVSPSGTASITSGGVLTGGSAGSATVTYTKTATGCYVTAPVTVLALPAAISGPAAVCSLATITLTDGSAGSWSVTPSGTASITSGGILTGSAAGTATVTFTDATTSCYVTHNVTVNALPGVISGPASVCSLAAITLTDTTTGGTWSVTPSGTASITSGGVLTGGTAGSATVTYTKTATGCYVTAPVTVLALPAAISGPAAVCSLATITLTDGSTGTWSVTPSGTASVTSGGLVTGGTAGTATVTFTDATTSCYVTHNVTVNALPGAISGPAAVCSLATITLTDTTSGGTWSVTPSGTASITSGGVLTGGTAGTATVTFTKTATGCYVTAPVIVKTLPGTIGGPAAVCSLATITLTDTAAGSWSVTPAATASITSGGVLTGGTAGTATVTFTSTATGCQITTPVTVHGLPGAIGGPAAVCSLAAITLTDTTLGGTWGVSPAATASITSGGVLTGGTAGTATVTYTNGATGCSITRSVTVNALPAPIDGGPASICSLSVMTMTDYSAPGTWSSNNSAIASIVASSGVVTGSSVGTTTITYTLTSNGCYVTTPITVNPLPSAISGTTTVCQLATTTLTSSPSGGTWSTDPASTTASVDATYGAVTGGSTSGVATITYALPVTGCYVTAPVTVNPIPTPITGSSFSLCSGGNVLLLGDATPSGSWSTSASSSIASVGSTGAVISGATAGVATITYMLPVTNCYVTRNITVNPTPTAFTGTLSVCQGATTTLYTTPAGGTWTVMPATPAVASVNPATGVVTGLSAGTATISYTMLTGCSNHGLVTVNAQPSAITGSLFVCAGGINTTTLHDSAAGGSWSIGPAGTASIDALTGVVTGGTAGTATATYTTSAYGCSITAPVIIAPLVPPTVAIGVTPGLTVCSGTPVTYTASVTNAGPSPLYVWSINGVITAGDSTYTYTPANGDVVKCWILSNYTCAVPDTGSAHVTMTVNSTAPSAVTISTGMGDTVCSGAPVTFTAVTTDGGPAPVYQWWVNYAPAGGSSGTLTYTPANGDIIAVKVTGDDICATGNIGYDTAVITVSGALTPGVSISSSSGGPVSCQYAEVTYTAIPVNGGMSPVYHWTLNGVPVGSTGNSYTCLPATGDVLAVTLTSDFPCLTTTTAASAPYNLTVIPITYPVIDVQAHPGFLLPGAVADTFIATILSGGGSAPTYQWFKNHFPIAGATTNTWVASTGILNQGDSIGCQVVNTDACSGVTAFNWYRVDYTGVSVPQVAEQQAQLMVMPNPNSGSFLLQGTLAEAVDEEVHVDITDMLGQTVYSGTVQAQAGKLSERITLSTQANGMYLLSIHSQHAQAVFHFVVNR